MDFDIFYTSKMFDGDNMVEQAMQLLANKQYCAVARMRHTRIGGVFEATQHFEDDWWTKNRKRIEWVRPSLDMRSSMVGDIFLCEKIAHLVCPVGFKQLPEAALPMLKLAWINKDKRNTVLGEYDEIN